MLRGSQKKTCVSMHAAAALKFCKEHLHCCDLTTSMLPGACPLIFRLPMCSAPYASVLDYSKFSVVIHVDDTSGWVSTPVHQQQAAKWVSEAGPPTHSITNMSQLLPTLRSISKERVSEMQSALQRVRRAFLWKSVLNPEQPSAVDIALHLALPSYQLNDSTFIE